MLYIEYTYEDEANNRDMDLEITYTPVPYVPARITSDPYNSSPPEGGYCEDFTFKVVSATFYNEEGEVIKEGMLSAEESAKLSKEFEEIYDKNQKLQEEINLSCIEGYLDEDDDGDCCSDFEE